MDNQSFHDRFIYTNYFTIYSVPGFNLFSNNTLKESNGLFFVKFTFAGRNMKNYPYHFALLKQYVNNCKQKDDFEMLNYFPEYAQCIMLN